MTPKFFDAHAHVNFAAFEKDHGEVIERALENGTWMMNVGTQKDTSQSAVELAHKYPEGVYAAVGLHPIHTSRSHHDHQELGVSGRPTSGGFTSRGEIFDYGFYKNLAADPKVLAIGECGLDYYRITNDARLPDGQELRIKQIKAFQKQIELAVEVDKPLMLHIRQAYREALEILKKYPTVRGNAHFFAGTLDEARQFLDFGFTLSFTGVITFTHNYDEIIQNTPLDMILSETDCPYVAPAPFRGKRNEPLYVAEVVKKIAEIKGLGLETCRSALLANARRVLLND